MINQMSVGDRKGPVSGFDRSIRPVRSWYDLDIN
jgi:hypothetical protein